MRKLAFFMTILSFMNHDLKASYKDYASQRQQKEMNITKSTSLTVVPDYKTAEPSETRFDDPHALNAATQNVFNSNEHAQTLKRTAEVRPYFVIDLEKDPIINHSKDSVQDPEKVLRSELYSRKIRTDYIMKTCRESKPPIEFKCSKTLLPPTVHIEPAKYSHYWCGSGNHRPDDSNCRAKVYYPVARMYAPEKVHVSPEAWTSDCGSMDKETKKRSCKLIKQVCPKGPETREVVATIGPQRQPTSRQITRPCWRYEYTYECSYPSPNTCEALRKSVCEQIESKCLKEMEKVCIEWEQTYRCPTQVNEEKEKVSTGNFSLPTTESPTAPPPNRDIQEAIARLSVLKDIQDDMRTDASSQNANSVRIFKGQGRHCTIAFAGFKNCCTDGKGWGVSLNLSSCSGEEKDLAERQKKSLCVTIGTYCAERVLGVCIRKKRSYCCFPTKLARILHEQGRGQLGIGWGEAKTPECRGFTIDEISRINFDQLNLSELFAEIVARTKQITQTTVNVVTRNLSDRVSQMTQGFKNQPNSGDF